MEKIYSKARAKINLNLLVLDKREDNYHNLKSVFQKVNLYDELYISKTKEDGIKIKSNIESLNNDENIIYKAYIRLKEKYKNITGVKVVLNKKIPMQAGMAGGSTDCASFVLGMNKLFELNLSDSEIIDISKSLGADVVPCLYNRALLAEGIGDKVTIIKTDFKYYIVIIKPNISCDTKQMYRMLDGQNEEVQKDNTDKIIKGLENNNVKNITDNLYNVFETAISNIDMLKEELKNNGALGSLMTGSGSCVYGIFDDKIKAKNAYRILKNKYLTYICTSYNSKKERMFW